MPKVNRETFQNSNISIPLVLPKGTLHKIDFGDLEQEVKRIWEGKPPISLLEKWKEEGKRNPEKYYSPPSMLARYNKAKQVVGNNSGKVGYCSVCKTNLNSHILKQKLKDCTIITRFCESCLPKV